VEGIPIQSLLEWSENRTVLGFDGGGKTSLLDIAPMSEVVLIFGNEARGIPDLPPEVQILTIPMLGHAESFNVASAAAIAMFHVSH
jgi:TrmH family RNA methyltransferase